MIDLACSVALLTLAGAIAVGFAARTLLLGRARYARVDRDGGSALFGNDTMSAGYWALEPVGSLLASRGVTPDAISAASLVCGLAAAVALSLSHFGLAAVALTAAGLCDALDGMVARATGRASDAGEVIDAAADRYQELVVFAALSVAYRADLARMCLALAALCGAVMTSYVTAKGEALGVELPRGAMRRPERALYVALGATLTPVAAALSHEKWVAHVPMLAALTAVALVANVSAARRIAALVRALDSRRPQPVIAQRDSLTRALGRHQIGSAIATVVDFGTMVTLVETLRVNPVAATACGALCGAASNFALGRRWIFHARAGAATPQALRYAFVSATSLGLNTLGEHLATMHGGHYLASRAAVAVLVSLCWNFPMQRGFVFRVDAEPVT